MKKMAKAVIILAAILAVIASNAFASVERLPITDRRAAQIAKKEVRGKVVDIERESNMIEVRIARRGDIIEVYIDERTGDVMMIESHSTEFESGDHH